MLTTEFPRTTIIPIGVFSLVVSFVKAAQNNDGILPSASDSGSGHYGGIGGGSGGGGSGSGGNSGGCGGAVVLLEVVIEVARLRWWW